jgi:putative ABC transport system permease protein
VMAYSVSQRTRELGIRIALGAGVPSVLKLVLSDGLKLVGLGLALGAIASYGAGQALASQLYATSSGDPLVFILVAFVLLGVALFACWIPARRATHINPVEALRSE